MRFPQAGMAIGVAGLMVAQGLVLTGTAHAATTSAYVNGSRLVVTAGQGEANELTISSAPGALLVTDVVSITPGAGCTAVTANEVSCTPAGLTQVVVYAGDKDDTVTYKMMQLETVTYGGDGSDVLKGGHGIDHLHGGLGADQLYGFGGNDELHGDEHADTLVGGADNDFIDGTDGMRDRVSYQERVKGVTVDLDKKTGGEPGEQDTIVNVTDIQGGSGDDILIGDAGANLIIGGPGVDIIKGGGGSDNCMPGGEPGEPAPVGCS